MKDFQPQGNPEDKVFKYNWMPNFLPLLLGDPDSSESLDEQGFLTSPGGGGGPASSLCGQQEVSVRGWGVTHITECCPWGCWAYRAIRSTPWMLLLESVSGSWE